VGSVKRSYSSGLRTAQARQTRRSVVSAASQLFVSAGYGATTIDAIADAAGVSRKTVFTAVGGKVELLKLALEWAVAGDDMPVAVADRRGMQAVLTEDDPTVLLTGWATITAEIDARAARLFQALEIAAGTDVEAQALAEQFEHQRLDGARRIVDRVEGLDALNPNLTRDEAVDLAWLSTDPTLYDRLVCARGWSRKRFEEWLSQYLIVELIGT
jgi:AcrR family transcriptional regulator